MKYLKFVFDSCQSTLFYDSARLDLEKLFKHHVTGVAGPDLVSLLGHINKINRYFTPLPAQELKRELVMAGHFAMKIKAYFKDRDLYEDARMIDKVMAYLYGGRAMLSLPVKGKEESK